MLDQEIYRRKRPLAICIDHPNIRLEEERDFRKASVAIVVCLAEMQTPRTLEYTAARLISEARLPASQPERAKAMAPGYGLPHALFALSRPVMHNVFFFQRATLRNFPLSVGRTI
jgi:hypothetical protein